MASTVRSATPPSVVLPVVPATTRLLDAIGQMQDLGVAALVVEGPGATTVLTVDDLLLDLRKGGDGLVGAVRPDSSLLRTRSVVAEGDRRARGADDDRPEAPEGDLDPPGPLDVLVTVEDGQASVLTGNEGLAATLASSVVLCRCRDDRTHVWRPIELALEGRCNTDGARVDCG